MNIKNYLVIEVNDYDLIIKDIDLSKMLNKIIFLTGELGSGKTFFIKQMLNKMSNFDAVTSPTFGIINTYMTSIGQVYHYDLYRINETSELEEIGLYDNLELEGLHLIEWPEIIPKEFIQPSMIISFQVINNHRMISIENHDE